MSKLIDDIKGFFNYFNGLRKSKPAAFYAFAAFLVIGAAVAIMGTVFFGFLPITAIMAAFAGLYLGTLAMACINILSRDKSKPGLVEFMKNYPIIFWGIALAFLAAIPLALLVAHVPALAALVTGNAVAVSLGLPALPINLLFVAVFSFTILAGIAGSLILQGLVDIAKDIGGCFGRGHTSKRAYHTAQNDDPNGDDYYYMPTKDGSEHPATTSSYSNPVVGAGGKPAAADPASPMGQPAPSFGMGSSGSGK